MGRSKVVFFQLLIGLRTHSEEKSLNLVSATKTTNTSLVNMAVPQFV